MFKIASATRRVFCTLAQPRGCTSVVRIVPRSNGHRPMGYNIFRKSGLIEWSTSADETRYEWMRDLKLFAFTVPKSELRVSRF